MARSSVQARTVATSVTRSTIQIASFSTISLYGGVIVVSLLSFPGEPVASKDILEVDETLLVSASPSFLSFVAYKLGSAISRISSTFLFWSAGELGRSFDPPLSPRSRELDSASFFVTRLDELFPMLDGFFFELSSSSSWLPLLCCNEGGWSQSLEAQGKYAPREPHPIPSFGSFLSTCAFNHGRPQHLAKTRERCRGGTYERRSPKRQAKVAAL